MLDEPKPIPSWGAGFAIIVDRFLDTFDVIVSKITSGKFIATVLTVWTYCKTIETCCKLVENKIIEPATFLAVMAGVAGLVTMIVKDYFGKDENKQGGSNEQAK